jgi:hypothetical protein
VQRGSAAGDFECNRLLTTIALGGESMILGMIRWCMAPLLLTALIASAVAGPDERFTVSGFGGYPISHSISPMWLAGPDHRPLLMVYFHGPEEWHNTKWKVDSKFEKGKPGWAELQSEKATLRLSMDTETGEAEVQSGKFKISESNTFLVLHAGETSVPQKIIPLGVFDLPLSKDQPAPVLLLNANPQLMERINKAVAAAKN